MPPGLWAACPASREAVSLARLSSSSPRRRFSRATLSASRAWSVILAPPSSRGCSGSIVPRPSRKKALLSLSGLVSGRKWAHRRLRGEEVLRGRPPGRRRALHRTARPRAGRRRRRGAVSLPARRPARAPRSRRRRDPQPGRSWRRRGRPARRRLWHFSPTHRSGRLSGPLCLRRPSARQRGGQRGGRHRSTTCAVGRGPQVA